MPAPVLMLTRDEAATVAKTSTARIDKAIHSGQLQAKRQGRRIVIPVAALEAYLDALPDA